MTGRPTSTALLKERCKFLKLVPERLQSPAHLVLHRLRSDVERSCDFRGGHVVVMSHSKDHPSVFRQLLLGLLHGSPQLLMLESLHWGGLIRRTISFGLFLFLLLLDTAVLETIE